MPEIIWACPLVQVPPFGMWTPKVVVILNASGVGFPVSWSTTSGGRVKPYAVGHCVVTDAQLDLLQADNTVYVFTEANWLSPFSSLPGNVRSRINAFCNDVGVAQPSTNEPIQDLYTRMTEIIDGQPLNYHISKVRGGGQ